MEASSRPPCQTEVSLARRYGTGFFGGKFLPLHKGHEHCIALAASECARVYVFMFHGGAEERAILRETPPEMARPLSLAARKAQLDRVARKYGNVIASAIDISGLILENGEDDWDAETPLVRRLIPGPIDAVYGSEASYRAYFARAYPEAVYRLVDPERRAVPISATELRGMRSAEELEKWLA